MIFWSTPFTLNVNVSFVSGATSSVIVYVTTAPSSSPVIADVNVAFVLFGESNTVSTFELFTNVNCS